MTPTNPRLLLFVACLSTAALAQTSLSETMPDQRPAGHASVLTGRTVGAGAFVVHPELGYPGASVGLLWGQSPSFDLGVRFSLGYGARLGFGFAPGVGAQAVMRWSFLDRGMISLGMRVEPGAFFGLYDRGGVLVVVPVGLDLGFHPHPIVNLALGFDVGVGLYINYVGQAGFAVPLSVGPGIELSLTDDLQLTFNTRFGSGYSAPFADYRGYGFKAAIGLAYRP